jgi:signal peptidase I
VLAGSVLVAGALAYPLAPLLLGGEAYWMGGDGMEPTLRSGDLLVVRRLDRAPSRGEVVLVHPFGDPADTYVQRVVAAAGDTVAMESGRLRLNGTELDEPYARPPGPRGDSADHRLAWMTGFATAAAPPSPTPATWGPVVVPRGHLLLLGDNRANDYDGRFSGFARCDWVVGVPTHIYMSFGDGGVRWRRIGPLDPASARESPGAPRAPSPSPRLPDL